LSTRGGKHKIAIAIKVTDFVIGCLAVGEVLLSNGSFGERARLMREELGLSQEALAAVFPPTSRGPRSKNWISQIESGKIEPALDELPLFEQALHADVRWLLTGEASGDTEFTARLRIMEGEMDARGRREVLATAQRQVDEAKRRGTSEAQIESLKAALVAAGVDPMTIASAELAAWRTLRGPDETPEADA
jgi:transcriptional regulator with XRE-family HTH domain